MSDSQVPPLTLDSVYFASLLLHRLRRVKCPDGAGPKLDLNNGALAHSRSGSGKFAISLATCLSRGLSSSQYRVLAVVPGANLRNTVLLVSNSTQQKERLSRKDKSRREETKTQPPQELEPSDTFLFRFEDASDLSTGRRILKELSDEARCRTMIQPTFSKYLKALVSLLFASASDSPSHIPHQLQLFVVANCIRGLSSRAKRVEKAYILEKINAWQPDVDEEIGAQWLQVRHPTLAKILDKQRVKQKDDRFLFDHSTAPSWLQIICTCFAVLVEETKTQGEERLVDACSTMVLLVEVIKVAANPLCCVGSLDCLMAKISVSKDNSPADEANDDTEADDDEAADERGEDETNDEDPLLLLDLSATAKKSNSGFSRGTFPANYHIHTRTFLRRLASVCSCIIAVSALFETVVRLARQKDLVIEITTVSPARSPISPVTPAEILEHWVAVKAWDEKVKAGVKAQLDRLASKTDILPRHSGEVHCEATAMTCLLLRALPPLERCPPGTEKNVREAFNKFITDEPLPFSPVPIGVSRKCCPICAILAKLLANAHNSLKIELPGHHSVYYPWVPPSTLPEDILKNLESEVLDLVQAHVDMVTQSTTSSPASNTGELSHYPEAEDVFKCFETHLNP
ncbi:hypothetical protein GGX14DRAFT_564732 [Mycena pura]|uniref:Uncharacterized protein n=1 Tax=Mycena pura TaxID=153505 RepID=A0AAD6VNV8_9AGAR|nr:hypothetical protein GGX14DRAFT_564732 [Mycena pura]